MENTIITSKAIKLKVANKIPFIFISLALSALLLGAIFGILIGFQYIFPSFLKTFIPFNHLRSFHVSTVIGWIILSVTGGIYYYVINFFDIELFSKKLMQTHLIIFIICAIAIYFSFFLGKMGGREYLTYAPIISLPILLGWILFGVNFFKTVATQIKGWPVYIWMWGTGIIFMIYHFTEAHLWLIPSFRASFINDITVQWKSYGSFVGSWNLLVYGTAIFLLSKIKNDNTFCRGKKAFFFYFLGLSNLMFGWAHHTYIIPSYQWIRYLSYITSMTEWILLINMIISFKKSLSRKERIRNNLAYKFLISADVWIFVNLFMALLISIPYINFFTHGTLITVAHSMGTTIGINTSILLASMMFIASKVDYERLMKSFATIKVGYWIFNSSLMVFLTSLVLGGVKKSVWMYFLHNSTSFGDMQNSLRPIMIVFLTAGIGLFIGLFLVVMPILKIFVAKVLAKNT